MALTSTKTPTSAFQDEFQLLFASQLEKGTSARASCHHTSSLMLLPSQFFSPDSIRYNRRSGFLDASDPKTSGTESSRRKPPYTGVKTTLARNQLAAVLISFCLFQRFRHLDDVLDALGSQMAIYSLSQLRGFE